MKKYICNIVSKTLLKSFKQLRLIISCVILALVFAFTHIIGSNLNCDSYTITAFTIPILKFIILFCVFFLIFAFIFILLSKIQPTKRQLSNKFFIFVFFGLLIIYLIMLYSVYPGIFGYDAPHQIWQVENNQIKNNQPVISSLIMYTFFNFGRLVGGTWEAGVFTYLLIQIFSVSFLFTYTTYLCNKHTKNFVISISIFLFFALFPVNQLFVINCAKDVFYSYIFLCVVIIFGEQLLFKNKPFNTMQIILSIIILLLFLFYRNNSIYILIPFVFATLIVFQNARKKLLIIFSTTIAIYLVIIGPVYSFFNYNSDNTKEMLAIPEQQIAYAYINNKNSFNEEEINMFKNIFPYKNDQQFSELYRPTNSDNIRVQLNIDKYSNGISYFLSNWMSIGIKNIKNYIIAFLNNTRGYWCFNYTLSNEGSDRYIEYMNSTYPNGIHASRNSQIPLLEKNYIEPISKMTNFRLTNLSNIFAIAAPFWLLTILIMYSIYKKNYKLLILLILPIMMYITLFAGPLPLLRYVYPISVCIPYLYSLAITTLTESKPSVHLR
ncbi:MAG: DUF6020 family protein [Coriobacteriia bacterium]|nr:DUF6020 family protein [Coriobacteriia bacterium]